MLTNQATQISITTGAKLTKLIGNGPSTTQVSILDDVQTVAFDSYAEGSVILRPSTMSYPLLPSSEMVLIKSDEPIDILINPGEGQILISQTRRFSIEVDVGVVISVSNLSETKSARINFLTTSKPPAVVA